MFILTQSYIILYPTSILPGLPWHPHLLHSCRGMPRGANFQGLRQNSSVAPTHHQGAANSTLGRKRVASDLKCWSLATRLKQYGNVKKHSINGSMEFHLCWFLLWIARNILKHIETSTWKTYEFGSIFGFHPVAIRCVAETQVGSPSMPHTVVPEDGRAWGSDEPIFLQRCDILKNGKPSGKHLTKMCNPSSFLIPLVNPY